MTRTGRIYKIIHNQSNIVYVGSTFNLLRQRWQKHKEGHKYKKNICAIHSYFEKYGIENFKIILIKEYQVVDKYHLRAYEQLWINKLKSINKNHSFPILKKIRFQKTHKKYREKNKEKIKKQKQKQNKIKMVCECGSEYKGLYHRRRHERTKKHLNYLSKKL